MRGNAIVAQTGGKVMNGCGLYSLNQLAVLIMDAHCVISNDTGLMHIATAFKKQIISLWGATVTEFGMYPYLPGEGSQILEAQSPQRPYSKHSDKPLFKPHYSCWSGLEPERVIQACSSRAAILHTIWCHGNSTSNSRRKRQNFPNIILMPGSLSCYGVVMAGSPRIIGALPRTVSI